MKILIGANGMLAYQLKRVFDFDYMFGHSDIDVTKTEDVFKLERYKPQIIVNASAYTKVDDAEDEKEKCFRVNYVGVKNLADFCARNNCKLIHYSTDYVFEGSREEGYNEDDEKNPINTYGLAKSIGEDYIKEVLEDYIIIRTSWLFGEHGKNFVTTMLDLAEKMKTIKVVRDQIGHPTYTKDLARKTKELCNEKGVFHITNSGLTSWYEFAKYILKDKKVNVVPCDSSEFKTKAKRPAYSALNNNKTNSLRDWREAVDDFLGR